MLIEKLNKMFGLELDEVNIKVEYHNEDGVVISNPYNEVIEVYSLSWGGWTCVDDIDEGIDFLK